MIVGIGIDAVEIDRVGRMFADKGERMLNRLFTGDELSYITDQGGAGAASRGSARRERSGLQGVVGQRSGARNRLARRRSRSRAPTAHPILRLHGRAEQRYRELGATSIHVSLTHSLTTAVAVVIVER